MIPSIILATGLSLLLSLVPSLDPRLDPSFETRLYVTNATGSLSKNKESEVKARPYKSESKSAIKKRGEKKMSSYETAIFAGGCFWCMEKPFDQTPGVVSTISGYTDGHKKDPTYNEVSSGSTGHTEAIQITFDSAVVSYSELLNIFWKNIDPVAENRQFCDKGSQYRSGIYVLSQQQQKSAEASMLSIKKAKKFDRIFTEIKSATKFYPAEEYHQNYYKKNPIRYKYYRYGCGRDKRLDELWK